jgi:hypothetical protein
MKNIYLQLREQGGNGRGGIEEEGDDVDFSDIESDDSSNNSDVEDNADE